MEWIEEIQPSWGRPGWQAVFRYNGQYYLADLTLVCYEIECMIFKCDHTGQFTFKDALGEYCNRDCEFSPEGLKQCIDEFIEQIKK